MQSNNRRIAKNTLFLYVQMFFNMLVALYTSRVVLNTLGVTDFGIYNVVGGVVAMFGFVTNTMASASQRFLAFDIGRDDALHLKKTFSVTFTIYLVFAFCVIILGETIGLWFVNHKLTIPPERMNATIWAYQISILTFIVSILRIPYNAAIIAHEKMGFYAWNSIIEVSFKLLIVFILIWFEFDKLILYSILTFSVVGIVSSVYVIYCCLTFVETKYYFLWDYKVFLSMFSFAGWNLFDSVANMGKYEGVNIFINIFFTPAINAARGIAFQVSSQVANFVGNYQMASGPQIIKYYAMGKKEEMKKLYFESSKYSYFLLFLITLPVYLNLGLLLKWWLKEVPAYTFIFLKLILLNRLIDSLAGTTNVLVQAVGKMAVYQIFSGITILLNLPISYIYLKRGYSPEITVVISIYLSFLSVVGRIYIMSILSGIKAVDYLFKVVTVNLVVSFASFLIPFILYAKMRHDIWSFFIIGIASVLATLVSIYVFGIKRNEREKIKEMIKSRLGRKISTI